MLSRYSLRRSTPALLGVFALIFTALLLLIQLPISQKNALNSWRNYTNHMLIQLQSSLDDHLRLDRKEEMATELSELGSLPNVQWAAVIDSQLQTIAATRLGLKASIRSQLDDQQLIKLMHKHTPTWRLLNGQRYLAIYPLNRMRFGSDDQSAALLVELDFSPFLRQTTNNVWLYLALALLLLLVLGFILNRLYSQLVLKRITHIAAVTQRYAAGNLQIRTHLNGQDEISQLGEGINSMLQQLESNHKTLAESELMLRNLINAAPIGLLVISEQDKIIEANPAAQQIFNMDTAQLCASNPAQLFSNTEQWQQLLDGVCKTTVLLIERNAEQLTTEAIVSSFSRDDTNYTLLLLNDISERKQAEQRLHYIANHDVLTGLLNRNNILDHVEKALKANLELSLILIDLDRFQQLNDGVGHHIGDQLLQAVANRLQDLTPAKAILARVGGDEFMLALQDASLEQAEDLAQQLLAAFKEPFKVLQYELFITASIGIAHHQDATGSTVQLLKHVDLALYHAKKIGRNDFVSFNTDLATDAALRQQLTDELRHALNHDEFELFYQPQVDATNCPVAMEALLRWRSSSRGLVSPDKFIPLLEETGMILEVSRWVFRTACRQASAWNKQGTPLRIAVNLSPLDFLQADLAGSLLSIMQEEQTPARLIELEITENSLLDSGAQVKNTLAQLKAAGLLLFLDDFGTGYSSLTYIKRFQFDGIKIDREFVAELPNCQQSIALVNGILTIAAHLDLEVVAEGVETQEQAAFLRQQGCQRLQGYYFSAAQPAAAHFTSTNTLKLY
jgi:diguanylate cyclase (GGDEF)-like protein/PAS domain S-box-containing protein